MRTIAMVQCALLVERLPSRLSRCLTVFPDEASNGFTPHNEANAASLRMRSGLTYLQNQWGKIVRYCDNGMIEIDNNRDERAVRPFAIGRKNWVFADTPKGAYTNARLSSLLETCKLHGHEQCA